MKTFIALLLYFIVTTGFLVASDVLTFTSEKYVDQKVLDLSMPLDVTIDTELLNSLKPANEQ
jgi:hypothetical protein